MTDEWLTDEFGKRYRMQGNVRVYETLITVSGGISVPESQLAAYNRLKSAAAEREREQQKNAAPLKACPFKDGANPSCRADCLLRTKHGCSIVFLVDRAPTAAQAEGRSCPFNPYMCRGAGCELWRGGCALTAI